MTMPSEEAVVRVRKARKDLIEEAVFRIGPDQELDLRQYRPYFVISLVETDDPAELQNTLSRIRAWISEEVADPAKGAFTDLYILSHGWHRNFYGAVSAYDRLVSRLGLLLRRGRLIVPPPDATPETPPERYHPVFLNLHWHSDPGENGFVDRSGRRSKASFLENVAAVFERDHPDFANDFEDIYELFSRMSAPGIDALSDPNLTRDSFDLTTKLDKHALLDAPSATRADKTATVWRCYHEAATSRVLLDQDEPAGTYIGLFRAVRTLIKFVVGVLGLVTLLMLLLRLPWARYWGEVQAFGRRIGDWLQTQPYLASLSAFLQDQWAQEAARSWVSHGLLLFAVACFLLAGAILWRHITGPNKPARGIPLFTVLSWAYLQFWMTLPVVTYCVVTFFFGWALQWLPGLFDERIGRRNETNPTRIGGFYPRYWLAELARLPITWLRMAVAKDSSVVNLADGIDSQLAFWEMQKKAVGVGERAAQLIADLLTDVEGLNEARLHFLGHSFGAVVVANAVRHLALNQEYNAKMGRKVHSVCLIQGALASNWFAREEKLRENIESVVACIYSRYDTANSFYYPLADHGRLAAGYVGLTRDGFPNPPETRSRFASLVRPPDLDDPSYIPPEEAQSRTGVASPRILNLDASRLIYDGPVAVGGGHGDIFKDDVVNLAWAVTRLKPPAPVASQTAVPVA